MKNFQDEKQRDLSINTSDGTNKFLTTDQGVRINDDNNSLKAGDRGPSLLEDFILREKITHFDHERIPERIVHARGSGAHGFFEVTNPIPEFSSGKRTNNTCFCPIFYRCRIKGLYRSCERCERFCRKVLYPRRNLRFGGQQYSGILYSGCFKISRSYSCCKTRAA